MTVPMVVIVKMLWLRETKRNHARTHTHMYIINKLIRYIHSYAVPRCIPAPREAPPPPGMHPSVAATATAVHPSLLQPRRDGMDQKTSSHFSALAWS